MSSTLSYQTGCRSCDLYKNKLHSEIEAKQKGFLTIKGKKVEWIVIDSYRKSCKTHYIFTTTSHHVGENDVHFRAELTKQATLVGYKLLGLNFRKVENTGKKTSSMTHYHAHLIKPGKDEVLARAVANIPKVINDLDAPEKIKNTLSDQLLQKKS